MRILFFSIKLWPSIKGKKFNKNVMFSMKFNELERILKKSKELCSILIFKFRVFNKSLDIPKTNGWSVVAQNQFEIDLISLNSTRDVWK